ncbi:MAG: helix-turn-helix domain-containing protein, partial [Planctomycetota bacterium]
SEPTMMPAKSRKRAETSVPGVPPAVSQALAAHAPVTETSAPIPGLPDKPTYRISEVAAYYSVTERTVYLWIQHGQLKTEVTPGGQIRVTRNALDSCRFAPKMPKTTAFSL